MSSEEATRTRRLLALIEELLELEPDERARALDERCRDEALRREVARRLALHESSGEVAPPAAGDRLRALEELGPAVELAAGTRLGSFEIVRLLGRGGMGAVFEARQDLPRRRVALKVLRLGLFSEETRRRFRWEVELLGRLRHPRIAQVHEAGVHVERTELGERETPWYAMELVEGARPLLEHADEHALARRERVALLAEIAEAVQHAHERGVLHRDLKPSNLLVDTQGHPKVIDFGVARALVREAEAGTLLTRTGEVVGTPAYMAPEQLAGTPDDVDVRCDVYALGVVLYQLLLGRLPHDVGGRPLHEAARAVLETPPQRPRRVDPDLPRDLEAVLLRALEREPHRRYASAGELGDDLRRWLAGEPVQASSPSAVRQLALFARRHKPLMGAGVAIALALVGATAVSLHFAYEERAAAARARSLWEDLYGMTTSFVSDFAYRVAELEGSTEVRARILERLVEELERLAQDAPEDPAASAVLIEAHLELGNVLGNWRASNLGDRDGARALFGRALELAEAHLREHPDDPRASLHRARALERLGDDHFWRNELESARGRFQEALAALDELAAASAVGEVELLSRRATVLDMLGRVNGSLKRFDTALAVFEDWRATLERLVELQPESSEHAFGLANCVSMLGAVNGDLHGPAEAVPYYEEAVEQLERLVGLEPGNARYRANLAEACIPRAMMLREVGQLERAEQSAQRALVLLERRVALDPEDSRQALMLVSARFQLGRIAEASAAQGGGPERSARAELELALERYERALAGIEDLEARAAIPPQQAGSRAQVEERIEAVLAALEDA